MRRNKTFVDGRSGAKDILLVAWAGADTSAAMILPEDGNQYHFVEESYNDEQSTLGIVIDSQY